MIETVYTTANARGDSKPWVYLPTHLVSTASYSLQHPPIIASPSLAASGHNPSISSSYDAVLFLSPPPTPSTPPSSLDFLMHVPPQSVPNCNLCSPIAIDGGTASITVITSCAVQETAKAAR